MIRSYISGSGDALHNAKRLASEARRTGVTVFNIRVVEGPVTNTAVWSSRHLTKPFRLNARLEGTPGADFHPDFRPAPGEVEIIKTRYSAFIGTGLESTLRSRDLDAVLLCGIATNICVERTMVDAFQLDLWPILVADCTAARSADEQERAVRDAERNWGMVATSDQIIEAWQSQSSGVR